MGHSVTMQRDTYDRRTKGQKVITRIGYAFVASMTLSCQSPKTSLEHHVNSAETATVEIGDLACCLQVAPAVELLASLNRRAAAGGSD